MTVPGTRVPGNYFIQSLLLYSVQYCQLSTLRCASANANLNLGLGLGLGQAESGGTEDRRQKQKVEFMV